MGFEIFITYILAASAAGMMGWSFSPVCIKIVTIVDRRLQKIDFFPSRRKITRAAIDLDRIFMNIQRKQLILFYILSPIITGGFLYSLFGHIMFAFLGGAVGLILPDVFVRFMKSRYKERFNSQIVEVIHMIVTSLRAGLSISQAVETASTELSPPASHEFGLVVKSNKMGLTLDESLLSLKRRMNLEDLSLMLNAILIAKETGGNVTDVLDQLSDTIREKRKLLDKVKTLTTQGKLQAYLMSLIPVAFAMFIKSTTPAYFEVFLTDRLGGTLLALAVVLWVIGVFLVVKLSKIDI